MAGMKGRKIPEPQAPVSVDPPGKLRKFSGAFEPRETVLEKPSSSVRNPVLPAIQPRRKPVLTNGVQR